MTDANSYSPVLMIAWDAAEPSLIEQWIADGTLPNLKRLRGLGSYGRLSSSAKWLSGSPWPTFYTGTNPANHGIYHSIQWRADQMRHTVITSDWKPVYPFWRRLSKEGRRVVVVDPPMALPPEPFNGVEIYSLVNRDLLGSERIPTSYPSSLLEDMRRELSFKDNPVGDETWGVQHLEALFNLRDRLIQGTRLVTNVAQSLIEREKWDLFIVSFMATHRGGHKLFNLSNSWETLGEGESYDALRDIYVSCDAAVGQLARAAGDEVTLIVFSLHGMRPNVERSFILPEMLHRILLKETDYGKKVKRHTYAQPLKILKHRIPGYIRYLMSGSPPIIWLWKHGWLGAAKKGKVDWKITPAFALEADLQGYIRINLRGREALGIVEAGNEYDQLCAKIAKGLATFVDADTGEPLVESVRRSNQLFEQGKQLKDLPDLIVQWVSTPAFNHRVVASPLYGSIPWKLPGRHPNGRSGNHGPEGFLLAVGTAIKQSARIEGANILDLAPTICALLKVPMPAEMCGDIINLSQS